MVEHHEKLKTVPLPVELMMGMRDRETLGALALQYDTGLGVFEFGTWRGLTTGYLADLISPSPVYTLETLEDFSEVQVDNIGIEYKGKTNVHQVFADSMSWVWAKDVGQRKFDLVFVDAGHSEENVRNDAGIAEKILRPGGLLVLHDYDENNTPGVCRYVESTKRDDWVLVEGTNMAIREIKKGKCNGNCNC